MLHISKMECSKLGKKLPFAVKWMNLKMLVWENESFADSWYVRFLIRGS